MVTLAVACAHALAARDLVDAAAMAQRHERWMAKHGRAYADDAEKARRLEVFRDNVAFIESVNAAASQHKFWLEENQFADLTNAEFRATRTGLRPSSSRGNRAPTSFRYANVSAGDLPASVDWRGKGAVNPVKDQGDCGCCWAFSAVAAMEGAVKLSTGKLVSLSEQQLVSCDGYEDVPANDEEALLKAVANQPVSVAIDGGDRYFQFYKGGVLSGATGCATELDHAITAVGYGVASDGTKYWLMKNSWGTSWGEDGYVRMERGVADKEGVCGLAMMASYPTA
uniref:Peptidase C1A papain C-terminal domain-containing protein n=1 Tax=Oryza barthii TaxID=65489 RepID=A0A0D3FT10_9ORYZ